MDREDPNRSVPLADFFAAQRREAKKENRRNWVQEHFFDLCNLVLALIAIVIAILGLYLP